MFSMNSLATKQQNMRGDYFEQDGTGQENIKSNFLSVTENK